MKFSPSKLNFFMLHKLPSAYFCGVRVVDINENECITSVRHNWFNKNPFQSMYFAVQAMAAEFTTGALVMQEIQTSGKSISMLVAQNKAFFTKKATGRITFYCNQGDEIKKQINNAIFTGQGQTFWLTSVGINEEGVQVSEMSFEWTIKLR
jgi:Domain of unknown function (DUF4442)